MSLSDADIAFATELFNPLPSLTTRKMFGGLALYSDGVIFALIRSDAQILIKAQDADFIAKIGDMGSTQWTTQRKNGAISGMPYWT